MFKQIMIPVAAFAVTATSVSAFNTDMLDKIDVDLTSSQIAALEEVHDLRESGADRDEVKAVLEAADLDRDTLREIRDATREYKKGVRAEIMTAVEAEDYEAFLEAVEGTRLAGVIDTEAAFERFVEAHDLRDEGDKEGARAILDELGIERPDHDRKNHDRRGGGEGRGFGERN